MAVSDEQRATLRTCYDEGKSRQEAMQDAKLTNTNIMSSVSSSMGLHWSWPLANRQSGEAPILPDKPPAPKRAKKEVKPKAAKTPVERRSAINISKIEGERLKANGVDLAVAPLDEKPLRNRIIERYGPSTHLSSREKHERGYASERPSHMPTPTDELSARDLDFLQRALYPA